MVNLTKEEWEEMLDAIIKIEAYHSSYDKAARWYGMKDETRAPDKSVKFIKSKIQQVIEQIDKLTC